MRWRRLLGRMQLSAVLRREGHLVSAWCPELDVASQGESQEEAFANLREAIALFVEDPGAYRVQSA